MSASDRHQVIAARCRVTGESASAVAGLIGGNGSHGLDDCTDEQRHFRFQLAFFLLNASPAEGWTIPSRIVADQRVWAAWAVLDRFLPYPETLVVTTREPDILRQVLTGSPNHRSGGMPGLRDNQTDPPSFLHLPTGTTLRVHDTGSALPVPEAALRCRTSGQDLSALTAPERHLLDALPSATAHAEQLLAALLVRLPLADPDGIWRLAKHHLSHADGRAIRPAVDVPAVNSHFLMGRGPSWHFRWEGPLRGAEVAAALTDTLTGLAGATAVLRPGHPLTVRYGPATLSLHGDM